MSTHSPNPKAEPKNNLKSELKSKLFNGAKVYSPSDASHVKTQKP